MTNVPCSVCGGTGSVELTGVYSKTLKLVIEHPGKNGAQLAKIAGCKATAMNNRLIALQRHGVVQGKKYGRQIFWTKGTDHA